MSELYAKFKKWFLPKPGKEAVCEIDLQNIKTIYYVTIIEFFVQTAALVMFFISHRNELEKITVINSLINVFLSIVLCLVGFLIARHYLKEDDLSKKHISVNLFVGGFMCLLIVWGMLASIQTYLHKQQIITFFTVELIAVLFIRLRPMITASMIIGSYVTYYIILNILNPGMVNRYNFLMMAVISVAGAVINYSLTVNYIEQKSKANMLNESLEIIANHDSLTRLRNRYALNQGVTDYVDTDICLAMGDINSFKGINDTYGHQIGDVVLKTFADILLAHFEREEVYRYGGDEFLIISRSDDYVAFRKKLNSLNEAFSKTHIRGADTVFSCSFGCASAHPKDPADFFNTIMIADERLYEEKTTLKNPHS